MTKVEAIVQPDQLDAVKKVLVDLGIEGMTISQVHGRGHQDGPLGSYRGHEYRIDLLPSIKFEVVLTDDMVDAAVDAIVETAATGRYNDGKIFLSKVDDIVRIRNRQRGVAAL